MSHNELEVDVMRLRWTLHTKTSGGRLSSEIRFGSGVWKLEYWESMTSYGLILRMCSGVCTDPLHVSVHVEGSEDGRTVDVLPEERRLITEEDLEQCRRPYGCPIWNRHEEEVLRSVPEFRLHGILRLIVVLRAGEDSQPKASQAQRSVVEATGQSGSTTRSANCTKSISVQTTLLMNELRCLESLTTDLDRLRVDDSHHDVEFHCEGHTTRAHKSIVCKRSPVIASMLSTDMVEGRTGIVRIPDMPPDIFAQFLRYLYSGRVEELTFDTALRLYEAGDQYEVLCLAKRCSEYLMEHLSVDNAYEVLVVFDAHNNRECVEKVVDYMVENRVPLVSDEWSAFCDEHSKLANKVLNRGWKVFVKTVDTR